MSRVILGITAAAALVVTAGAAFAADQGMGNASPLVYKLSAIGDSGQSGTVTLTSSTTDGKPSTTVVIALTGEPAGATEPAHLHTTPCPGTLTSVAYGLTSVVDGKSTTVVPAPIEKFASGYSVNIHKSKDEIKTYVACGDLKS
jgi:hypothetical protein